MRWRVAWARGYNSRRLLACRTREFPDHSTEDLLRLDDSTARDVCSSTERFRWLHSREEGAERRCHWSRIGDAAAGPFFASERQWHVLEWTVSKARPLYLDGVPP